MRRLSEAEVATLSYGDANLVSLAWRGDAEEPTFVVTLQRGGTMAFTIVLAFSWPEVDIVLGAKHGFVPLTSQGGDDRSVQRLDDGRWSVTIDFAHQGTIHVVCHDIFIDEA